ncbi:MAG: hypothetical protein DMF61_21235 [Blastocatellia bacterium AA13]|nr:MAG: hypothetical protein DMF61_21235 [Blastocatellia bacterium AA13]
MWQLEIFKSLYASVAEEMGISLRRSAFSPNIKLPGRASFHIAKVAPVLFGHGGEFLCCNSLAMAFYFIYRLVEGDYFII